MPLYFRYNYKFQRSNTDTRRGVCLPNSIDIMAT